MRSGDAGMSCPYISFCLHRQTRSLIRYFDTAPATQRNYCNYKCQKLKLVINRANFINELVSKIYLFLFHILLLGNKMKDKFYTTAYIYIYIYIYISLTDHVRNEEVLLRVNEQRNILHEIRKRKANWIGHILRRNCLVKQIIEGKIKGQIEVTRRRGRRRKKLLGDLKDRRGYCQLKKEALDRTMWRNHFGRGFGPVAWQITDDDDDDEFVVSMTWSFIAVKKPSVSGNKSAFFSHLFDASMSTYCWLRSYYYYCCCCCCYRYVGTWWLHESVLRLTIATYLVRYLTLHCLSHSTVDNAKIYFPLVCYPQTFETMSVFSRLPPALPHVPPVTMKTFYYTQSRGRKERVCPWNSPTANASATSLLFLAPRFLQ